MLAGQFEWDPAKAAENLRKHLVTFHDARRVFDDIHAFYRADRDSGHGEQRGVVAGMVNGVVLTVVFTERGDVTRIISARKATGHEQFEYDRSRI